MPKRKRLPTVPALEPDYTGIPGEEKLVVQKSNPLQTLSQTDITLSELKILDAYLSRIDSHKPEMRYVRFEKGELESILGVDRIRQEELEKRLKGLFKTVEITDVNKPKGFKLVALFEKADVTQDEETGLWQVDLICTASAMEYIFNIENLGYLRYRLGNVINLKSRYSYVLYLYLENNRFRKSWTVSLIELKRILNCNAETYSQFKRFNDLVLKPSYEEIHNKVDSLIYSYTPIRTGRKVTAIQFEIFEEVDYIETSEPERNESAEEKFERMVREYRNSEEMTEFAQAVDYEFDYSELEEILEILRRTDIYKDTVSNSKHYGRIFYLREMYKKFLYYCNHAESPIKNRFKYFTKMLEDEAYMDKNRHLKNRELEKKQERKDEERRAAYRKQKEFEAEQQRQKEFEAKQSQSDEEEPEPSKQDNKRAEQLKALGFNK